MFIRWFLAIIFSLQVFTALASDLPGNPANDTKIENLQRYKNHLQNQLAYQRSMEEVHASIAKDSSGRDQVKQMLTRSGLLEDGSKAELKTVVTQTPNKAKVAQVLTERLKNAKDYAKNLGKASIPSFVGMAAFHGLMEGIGWVMDEGGKIQMPEQNSTDQTIHPYHQYYYYNPSGGPQPNQFTSYDQAATLYMRYMETLNYKNSSCSGTPEIYTGKEAIKYSCNSTHVWGSPYAYSFRIVRNSNPNYDPSSVRPDNPPTDQELQTALKNALESNNPSLAAAIADAIKSAYSYDRSEGQKPSSNTLAKEAADDMAVALPKAFDNPVPTSNPERPSGYYKITDGDKTVEGYVTPAPIGGTTDTTTTPTIDPVTGQPTGGTSTTGGFQLPAFCDWAAVVCDFIDWVKSDEELPEDEEPQVDTSLFDRKFDFSFNASAQCPPNPIWNFTFINQEWSKELDITMICQMFRWLGFAINIASNMTALWIVYSAVVVRDKA